MPDISFNQMVESQQNLDNVFGALADPTRRDIVARLARGPRTVGELARPFDMSLAAVSKHVHVLARAGLVERNRRGRTIECSLNALQLKSAADWVGDYEKFWTDRLTELEAVIKGHRGSKS